MKEALNKILDFFGFLSEDQRLSLTNITVITFLSITAFKSLFGGLVLTIGDLATWTIQPLDLAATLPLLFGLLNYSHRRTERIKDTNENKNL